MLTLHASAVRVGDAAVVFAGASGTGKSTLAAYLASCGHVVQSDGFVAIVDTRATPMVLAGPATQKLWPDAAEWLGLDPMHPRVAPATTKYLIAEPHTLARDAVPLARIYVLDSTLHGVERAQPGKPAVDRPGRAPVHAARRVGQGW